MSVSISAIISRLTAEGLLVDVPGTDASELGGRTVDRVTTDSRLVRPGTLFCAVRGVAGDGHRFVGSASAAGAVAALVETAEPALPIPQIVVGSGRRAAAYAAAELYADPWREQTLIGVTGTNGKTTTVSILRHLLAKRGPAASLGTLGLIGADGRPVPGAEGLTTPGPAQFAEIMRGLLDQGVKAVAMEVSSHALEQDRVAAATFAAGIFTSFSRDHLDYHGGFDAYRAAKLKLVELIRPAGVLALNIDDPAWEGVQREGVHLVRFGTQGRGEVQAEQVEMSSTGARWTLYTPSCTAPVQVPITGIYNVYNALGAAAALWGLGWTADFIAESLADLEQIPGRMERIPSAAGPQIIIDYAHTPDALERVLRAARQVATGRVIVVFGAGGNRDRGKRQEMGRVAASNADLSIVTTDNPRHEDPISIAEDIEGGMADAPRQRIIDRRDAIERAIELATPHDVVLLAGKGHETYQIWGDEYRPFDERVVVKDILRHKGVAE
jgi:UDP-N-acetylmuramoyl-L-alanyl-D-glutamate--2,6-diaminopimelate ligase